MRDIELKGGDHAVMLIHGLCSSPLELMYVARGLNRAGFTVNMPSFSGYACPAPDGPRARHDWRDWRAQVAARFDALKGRFASVSAGGLCIGAVLALDLAAERGEEVAGLALMATTLFYDGWSLPWTRVFLPLGFYTPVRYFYSVREREPYGLKNEQLRRWVEREMREKPTSAAGPLRLPMTAVFEAHRLMKRVRRALPRVVCPTLILHATEDDIASVRSADYVTAHIGAQQVRKVLLHNSYHMLSLDNDKEEVIDESVRFLSRCAHPAGGQGPDVAATGDLPDLARMG